MTNEDHDHKSLNDGWARFLPERFRGAVVPVVRLNGAIGAVTPLRPGLTLSGVSKLLEKAFETKRARAVALVINSPGGSPVQSRQIYARIRQLAEAKKIPVLVFVEDVAASGGYMIALAGDEIIADPSSIVGSIGVVSASFGFQDLIKKIGVERRVHTAGQNKSVLDPFRPEKKEDVERLKALQLEVHETFIDLVRERRGKRLADDPDLFTGLFWSAKRGLALGLVDSLGDMRSVLKARFGDKTKLKLVTQPRGFLARRLGFLGSRQVELAPEIAAGAAGGLLDVLEERALWSRFGL